MILATVGNRAEHTGVEGTSVCMFGVEDAWKMEKNGDFNKAVVDVDVYYILNKNKFEQASKIFGNRIVLVNWSYFSLDEVGESKICVLKCWQLSLSPVTAILLKLPIDVSIFQLPSICLQWLFRV